MSFEFGNVEQLGNQLSVAILTDEHGDLGRECPNAECEGYSRSDRVQGSPAKVCLANGAEFRFWERGREPYSPPSLIEDPYPWQPIPQKAPHTSWQEVCWRQRCMQYFSKWLKNTNLLRLNIMVDSLSRPR